MSLDLHSSPGQRYGSPSCLHSPTQPRSKGDSHENFHESSFTFLFQPEGAAMRWVVWIATRDDSAVPLAYWSNIFPSTNPDSSCRSPLGVNLPEIRSLRISVEGSGGRFGFERTMWPPGGAPVLLLGALAVLHGVSEGSSSHSLRYIYTGVSEPSPGLLQFVVVGYVDDQLFVHYDSNTRKMQPKVPWIKKVEDDDPQYWETETQNLHAWEELFRANVEIVRNYYNQSKGFHSWQLMCGCELRPDGSKGGYYQYAYDGKDYISFDKGTKTWTAADSKAQITKRKWEKTKNAEYWKAYLEGICIEWLQRYLDYGKENLLRTEPPVGKVTRKAGYDGRETLFCQAHGFYPKEIETTWRKHGEVLEDFTFRKNVAPYPDGTYHAWLSIEIDPKERDQYQCYVDHAGLVEPLVLAWEEPASNLWLIIGCGCIVLFLTVAGTIVGFCFYKKNKKHQEGYNAPLENNLAI